MTLVFAGVDGCSKGWVALVLPGEDLVEGHTTFASLLADLAERGVMTIGVDMPLSAPEWGERECELKARALLGAKRSSIFITPTQAEMKASTQAEATAINREHGGKGVSAQAFNLLSKIAEIAGTPCTAELIEVHPELTFHLLGQTQFSKKTWAGVRERIAILEAHGLDPMTWQSTGWGLTDDTLDAAAAALTAQRYGEGTARRIPDSGDGTSIWA